MYQRVFFTVLLIGLLHAIANSSEKPAMPFVDGRWSGGLKTGPDNRVTEECWAQTTFSDGTVFTLAKRRDENWHLIFSNPGWRLPLSLQYDILALVDFYPQLHVLAEAKSETRLEIADHKQNSLLGLIENGHTLDLKADGFSVKYDLEGSAKIIERLRNCIAD